MIKKQNKKQNKYKVIGHLEFSKLRIFRLNKYLLQPIATNIFFAWKNNSDYPLGSNFLGRIILQAAMTELIIPIWLFSFSFFICQSYCN